MELPQQSQSYGEMVGLGAASSGGFLPALPSMAAGAQTLPSMDPSLASPVASQYGQVLLQQQTIAIQESMQLQGQYSVEMRKMVSELSSVGSNLQQIDQLLAGALQGLRQTATSGQAAAPSPSIGEGAAPAPTQSEEGGPTLRQRFSEGRQMVQSRQSMGQVARRMAGRAADSLSQRGGTWDLTPDSNGNINFYDGADNITDSMPATAENIAKATRYGERITQATGLLNRYAQGQSLLGGESGLLGGLGEGVLKFAGPVGMAIGAAEMGFSQFASQTEAGAQYRAAYGTDAGRFAFSQRAGADLAGVGGFFSGIGFGRAKENYEAAAAQGLTGDRLSGATDFMNTMYAKLGLDTAQSVQAVQISAENTNISLGSLSDQIMAVSKAAVDAGKNSEVAVQSFLSVTQQVQQNVSNTASAPVIAGNISTAIASELPSSLNTPQMAQGLAGLVTSQNIALIAGRTGQSYGSLMAQVETGQPGAAEQIIGGTIQQALISICLAGAGMQPDALRAEIRQMFPGLNGSYLNSDQQMQVFSRHPNLATIIQQVFQQYGLPISQGDAATTFFSYLMSNMSQFGQPGQAGGATGSGQMRGAGSELFSGGSLSSVGMKALGIQIPTGASSIAGGRSALNIDANMQQLESSGATGSYLDYARSTGNRDTAVERFLRSQKTITAYTGKPLGDVQFTMQDGSQKSFAEILRDPALLAQFNAGTPYYHSGTNSKETQDVGDITHMGGAAASTGVVGKSAPLGGGYTIGLTSQAQKLFNLIGPSTAQQQGVPPIGSVSPDSYVR